MVTAIKEIRNQFGCSLVEAREFYDRGRTDWQERIVKWKEENKGQYFVSPEQKLRDLIRRTYFTALENSPDGVDLAAAKTTVEEMCNVLRLGLPVTPREGGQIEFLIVNREHKLARYATGRANFEPAQHLPLAVKEYAEAIYCLTDEVWVKCRGPESHQKTFEAMLPFLHGIPYAKLEASPSGKLANCALVHEESGFHCGAKFVKTDELKDHQQKAIDSIARSPSASFDMLSTRSGLTVLGDQKR